MDKTPEFQRHNKTLNSIRKYFKSECGQMILCYAPDAQAKAEISEEQYHLKMLSWFPKE